MVGFLPNHNNIFLGIAKEMLSGLSESIKESQYIRRTKKEKVNIFFLKKNQIY